MKRVFILSVIYLSSVLPVLSQDYSNICPTGTTLWKTSDNHYEAFRRDITTPLSGSDTLFTSYRAIRDSSDYLGVCYDTSNGDALGRKIWKRSNGWFWFFNQEYDTVYLNTQAGLNQSWKFCAIRPWGDHLQATVTAFSTDTVFGISDPVKVITLQAKDQNNQDVESPFNGKSLKLSQHYGFTSLYDIYKTPYDTIPLRLAGRTTPPLGIQPLTWRDIYNFDAGDVFHFYYHEEFNGATTIRSTTIDSIIDKTVYGNMDSVHYTVEWCYKKWYPIPPPNSEQSSGIATWRYNFLALESDTSIRLLPDEFYFSWSIGVFNSQYHARLAQLQNHGAYLPSNNCYGPPFESWGPINIFAAGLGNTDYEYSYADLSVYGYYNDLAYYKKGNEVWGTPLAASCSVLLGIPVAGPEPEVNIRVVPNPVEETAVVSLTGTKLSLPFTWALYNFQGVRTTGATTGSDTFTLDIPALPPGIYLLVVSDRDGRPAGKTKVVKR